METVAYDHHMFFFNAALSKRVSGGCLLKFGFFNSYKNSFQHQILELLVAEIMTKRADIGRQCSLVSAKPIKDARPLIPSQESLPVKAT